MRGFSRLDSGFLHTLLNLRTTTDLEAHPKSGASWEGFVIDQLMRRPGIEANECFFWATHAGDHSFALATRARA